jgi:hypothetical protein
MGMSRKLVTSWTSLAFAPVSLKRYANAALRKLSEQVFQVRFTGHFSDSPNSFDNVSEENRRRLDKKIWNFYNYIRYFFIDILISDGML